MNSNIDAIYCISLERIPDRRKRSIELLSQLNFCPVYFFDAIDSHKYTIEDFNRNGVFVYKNWEIDESECTVEVNGRKINYTYWTRPVTMGEVACTVSHYLIWKRSYEMNHKNVLIFEDDIVFELDKLLYGLNVYLDFSRNFECDLFYLGCIPWLDGKHINSNVIECKYAYQLHSYILSHEACGILINSGLMENLIVSDEYVPALYSEHFRHDVRELYHPKRKLLAYRLKENVVGQADNLDGSQTALNDKEKFGR